MIKLAPFYPAIVVLIGAIFVAAGGFWASYRQSNFNMEIRAKNEEIAALQKDNADAITGGDSFAEAAFSMLDRSGNMTNAFSMPDQLLLVPTFIHRGKHPLYDVSVRFTDLQAKFDAQNALRAYPIGNMTPGLATITGGINLPHDGKDLNFNIFFVGRNGMWIQFLRMPWMGDGWGRASKIERNGVVIFEEISKNFPLNEKGAVDWDHPATNRETKKPDAAK